MKKYGLLVEDPFLNEMGDYQGFKSKCEALEFGRKHFSREADLAVYEYDAKKGEKQ